MNTPLISTSADIHDFALAPIFQPVAVQLAGPLTFARPVSIFGGTQA